MRSDHTRQLIKAAREHQTKRSYTTAEARFWGRIDRRGADECWPWKQPFKGYYPYVSFRLMFPMPTPAYRVAFSLVNGIPEKGIHICHTCGNHKCCNPSHLYKGSPKTNHADAVRHGTFKPLKRREGEDVHNAKLTAPIVMLVRKVYPILTRYERGALAELIGVHTITLRRVAQGKQWIHVQPV